MIAELGHYCLILVAIGALIQGILPIYAHHKKGISVHHSIHQLVTYNLLLILFCFFCLIYLFVSSDFSVLNVFQNSHSSKPLLYKISASWGNHEGSLLLWNSIIALYSYLAWRLAPKNNSLTTIAIGFQGLLLFIFVCFTLFVSNPFGRLMIASKEGLGFNPILQDPAVAFHPPALYMGYVGFSLVFSYALSGLIQNKIDQNWALFVKPWALLSWTFLTLGIGLGSLWAYYELGWGGWWFWDPVENASLMPWLIGTALIHSLSVSIKRKALLGWTVLLALFTFLLSVLGTFLVRSGVLSSIHAFALDPQRGLFLLFIFFILFTTAAFLFFRFVQQKQKDDSVIFKIISRESALVYNNIFLVSACAMVLVGTLYPLIINHLGLESISIGPPYYQKTFIPMMVCLLFIMAIAPLLQWKKDNLLKLKGRKSLLNIGFILIGGITLFILFSDLPFLAILGFGLGLWLISGSMIFLYRDIKIPSWRKLSLYPAEKYAVILGHAGLGVAILGIVGSSYFSLQINTRLAIGETVSLGGYQWQLENIEDEPKQNHIRLKANLTVYKDKDYIATLTPEKRLYFVQKIPTTEIALYQDFMKDFYVLIGDWGKDSMTPSFQISIKPLQSWLWFGWLLIVIAGGLGVTSSYSQRINYDHNKKESVQRITK